MSCVNLSISVQLQKYNVVKTRLEYTVYKLRPILFPTLELSAVALDERGGGGGGCLSIINVKCHSASTTFSQLAAALEIISFRI